MTRIRDIFLLSTSSTSLKRRTLKAVWMLMRHGDRAPVNVYPTYPYNWPGGLGMLSPKGAEQMKQSGENHKSRYGCLIRDSKGNIDYGKILVLSSRILRCILSAKYFLDGFLGKYPPNMINVLSRTDDEMLAERGKVCPKYQCDHENEYKLNEKFLENYFKVPGEFKCFSDYIKDNTGLNGNVFRTVFMLEDVFAVGLDNGLTVPPWAETIYTSHLKPMAYLIFAKLSHSPYMQIRSGVLLRHMVDRFEQCAQGSKKNVNLYFAHDLTMSGLMVRLNVIDQAHCRPDYGAVLTFELYENPELEDGFEIKVLFYRNYSDNDPVEIKLPNCEKPYSFRQFKESIKDKLVCSYETTCKE